MLKKFILLIFIVNANAIDWKVIQSSGPLPEFPSSDICEVGKYYRLNCNVCECVPPGIHKCGVLSCIGDEIRTGGYAGTGCVIGTSFHNWCNVCNCYDGAHATCTNHVCPKNHM